MHSTQSQAFSSTPQSALSTEVVWSGNAYQPAPQYVQFTLLLTLYTTPAVYLALHRFSRSRTRKVAPRLVEAAIAAE